MGNIKDAFLNRREICLNGLPTDESDLMVAQAAQTVPLQNVARMLFPALANRPQDLTGSKQTGEIPKRERKQHPLEIRFYNEQPDRSLRGGDFRQPDPVPKTAQTDKARAGPPGGSDLAGGSMTDRVCANRQFGLSNSSGDTVILSDLNAGFARNAP